MPLSSTGVYGLARERVYRRLDERRNKTLANFERRYGRRPTVEEHPRMALFPRKYKNARGEHAVTHPCNIATAEEQEELHVLYVAVT